MTDANTAPRRTPAAPAAVTGVTLFSARAATATFNPADAGTGLVFRRTDLPAQPIVPARVEFAESRPNRSALVKGDASVDLVEHALAALAGLGITDCLIDLDGPELPIADGSAKDFADALTSAGIRDLNEAVEPITVTTPVTVSDGDASVTALPHDRTGLDVTYRLLYDDDSPVPPGVCAESVCPRVFAKRIAAARTFTTEDAARAARDAGHFKHLDASDMLVFGPGGPISNGLRFPDEPARHKLLDVIGDLALVGAPLHARVLAHRSGHELNRKLAAAILEQHRAAAAEPFADIRRVMEFLPHRYPMLLVDRVTELVPRERITGIKNVTINEPFFQGHYPANPIMPGVLIVEAMGQLAGVMVGEAVGYGDTIALLLAIDGVRLRRPVIPGDRLLLTAEAVKIRKRLAEARCTASVDGETAAEATIKFMIVHEDHDPS